MDTVLDYPTRLADKSVQNAITLRPFFSKWLGHRQVKEPLYRDLSDAHELIKAVETLYPDKTVGDKVKSALGTRVRKYLALILVFNGLTEEDKQILTNWSTVKDTLYQKYSECIELQRSGNETNEQVPVHLHHVDYQAYLEEKMQEAKVKWFEAKKIHDPTDKVCQMQGYLILLLYSFRVLRNDYRLLKFRNWKPDIDNYIETRGPTALLSIHDLKTRDQAHLHISEEPLPPRLCKYLRAYLKERSPLPGDFLFIGKRTLDKALSSDQWSALLNDILEKGVSSRVLRRMNATSVNKDLPDTSDIFKRAAQMQHSVSTHLGIYRRSPGDA